MTNKAARVPRWPPRAGPGARQESALIFEKSLKALEQSFLGALPLETLKLLLREAYPTSLPAGTKVDFDRDTNVSVCLVLEGLLSSYISSHGRQVSVRYNRPGSIFGIVDLVGGAPPWSAGENRADQGSDDGNENLATRGFASLTDSSVLVMSSDVLRTVALSDPVVTWALAREVTRVLYGMVYELSSSVFGSVRQRLAHHLLEISTWDPEHAALVAVISQQDLADMMGTVREVVTRTMSEFRRDGMVERIDSGILIKDALALNEIVREARV
jgi:CRP/FNR family transcriptional regulator